MEEEIRTKAVASLKKSFDKYYQAPVAVWNLFISQCDTVTFNKDEIIKKVHEKEAFLLFYPKRRRGRLSLEKEQLRMP